MRKNRAVLAPDRSKDAAPFQMPPDSGPEQSITLRILATSDLHMHLLPWDYYTDRPSRSRGLSLVAGLIAQARAEVSHSILLDNGDFLQGSPLGDFIAETAAYPADATHPMIAAMNHLAYDAVCIGNHEFSHGLAFLEKSLAKAQFPVLSANVLTHAGNGPDADRHFVTRSVIVTRSIALSDGTVRPLRIGLVGLTPPQVMQWEQETLRDRLQIRGMFETAALELAHLRKAGADLVVALAHSGFGEADAVEEQENTVLRLARDLDFDAILAGHTHNSFPSADFATKDGFDPQLGLIHGRPTVMPGFYGSHLGVIDLRLAPLPGGGWQVRSAEAGLRPVYRRSAGGAVLARVAEDPDLRAIALPAHRKARRWARRQIGETLAPIHSYFSLIAPSAAVQLVAAAQADHVQQSLRGSLWEGLPILSAAAPFRAGGRSGPENYTHIQAGPLTLRNIADLYTFPNTIIALLLNGAEVKDWLERAAALFHHIAPGGQPQDLINADMPGFDFDMLLGVSYDIDLSRPPLFDAFGHRTRATAGRIRNLRIAGRDLDLSERLILATNSYRLGGGGGYVLSAPSKVILRGGQSIRSLLAAYVSRTGDIPATVVPNWRFSAMPGTVLRFATSPRATEFMAEVAGLHPGDEPPGENGFQTYRLSL